MDKKNWKTFVPSKQNDYPTSDSPIKSNRAITLRTYRNRIRLNTTREWRSREITKWISRTRDLTRERRTVPKGCKGNQLLGLAQPILSPSVNVLKQSALFAAISSISISRRLSRSTPWATIYVVVRGCFDGGQPEVNLRFTRQCPPLTSTSSSTPQTCDGGWYRGGGGIPRKGNEERKEGKKGRALEARCIMGQRS